MNDRPLFMRMRACAQQDPDGAPQNGRIDFRPV